MSGLIALRADGTGLRSELLLARRKKAGIWRDSGLLGT
jgi:hypothetical protein